MALVLLLAAACGSSSSSTQTGGTGSSPTTSSPAAASGPTAVGVTEKDFEIALDSSTAAPGTVQFAIDNNGPSTHEFVVVRTDLTDDKLPVEGDEVNEEDPSLLHVDEQEDIASGTTATLSVDLQPGHYVLFCNVTGHYQAGMHTTLEVTGTAAATDTAVTEKDFAIAPDPGSSGPGVVNFNIDNQGPSTHEFVVVRTDLADDKLPVTGDEVNEDDPSLEHIGEQEDIAAGSSTSLSLYLVPGHYVLFCNVTGHYQAGMHTSFTVGT